MGTTRPNIDSLAATQKVLLLGAGFSYDLGMPLTAEVTEVFFDFFKTISSEELEELLSVQEPYGEDRPINMTAIREGVKLLMAYKASVASEEIRMELGQIKSILNKQHGT